MATRPTVGGSDGSWGTELNDHLDVSLDTDGKVDDGAAQTTSAAPGADAEIANKKYVDDEIATEVTNRSFGIYTNQDGESNAMLKAHAYLANQDGFVTATVANNTAVQTLIGYIGSTTDPVGAGDLIVSSNQEGGSGKTHSISFPVASGKYFEVRATSTNAVTIFWHPIGTLVKPTDQN